MEIKNLNSLVNKLRTLAAKARTDSEASVAVGYTAAYAIFVHENMEPKTLGMNVPRKSKLGHYWGPSDFGPKFLERPARDLGGKGGVLGNIVAKALQAKQTMASALVQAGLRLQRESQQLVPVEFGNLRASAFTRLE